MTAQKLGGKLAAWMELEGLTDRQLAERLRMDASYIWMLRTGTRPISDGFRWRSHSSGARRRPASSTSAHHRRRTPSKALHGGC